MQVPFWNSEIMCPELCSFSPCPRQYNFLNWIFSLFSERKKMSVPFRNCAIMCTHQDLRFDAHFSIHSFPFFHKWTTVAKWWSQFKQWNINTILPIPIPWHMNIWTFEWSRCRRRGREPYFLSHFMRRIGHGRNTCFLILTNTVNKNHKATF